MSENHETTSTQILPDYEPLFNETTASSGKFPFKIILKTLRAGRIRLIVSYLFFIIQACPVWLSPIITANIINAFVSPTPESKGIIIGNLIAFCLLIMINVPCYIIYARHMNKTLRNIGAGFRNTLIKKLQHLSITYHKNMESGRLQSKFLRDIETIENFYTLLLKNVLTCLLYVIAMCAICIYKSWIVSLFYLVVIPANIMLARIFKKRMERENHSFRSENEHMSAKVTTMIEMLPVTKAHGLEDEEISKIEETIKRHRKSGVILDKTQALFGSVAWAINQVLGLGCLLFTIILAYRNIINIGDIIMYRSYFSLILAHVESLINSYPQLAKGLDSLKSVSEVMFSDRVEETRNKYRLRRLRGDIEFENVSFSYPDSDEHTIKDLSFKVRQGECVAFVGASGCGKTTIMNMLIGFLLPTKGTVKIDGCDIKNLNLSEYRHHLSVVPQTSILFTGTIRENILYGMDYVPEDKFQEIVEAANINQFLKDLPCGLNTIIGEHGDKLSGGQKQRISIARALIRDPDVLILDEATSALDNISEHHVQEAISRLIKGRTTFIVAHRLSTIRNADRIFVMDKGRLVETGTYDELMEKKGAFYELKKLSDIAPTEE